MHTLTTCAQRLACSERTVRREIAAGRLIAVRVRGLIRVTESALLAYIEALPPEPACPSVDCRPADIRSELLSVADSVLNARFRPALPKPTRGRSKMHYSAERSTLRLAENPND